MKIFILEFVCSGAMRDQEISPSLLAEARGMLEAVLQDFAAIPNCEVVTIWDSRIPLSDPLRCSNVEIHKAGSSQQLSELFQSLASDSDNVFLIAPEFDNHLLRATQQLAHWGAAVVGCDEEAVKLCGDKLATAQFLQSRNIPTISTTSYETSLLQTLEKLQKQFPHADVKKQFLLKPNQGAGSLDIFVANSNAILKNSPSSQQLEATIKTALENSHGSSFIAQPILQGTPLSVSVLINRKHNYSEILPVTKQLLTNNYQYRGCQIPARLVSSCMTQNEIQNNAMQIINQIINDIPGLDGYIGIDLILTPDGKLFVVEINPRLTTSYLGYRKLTTENLMQRLLPEMTTETATSSTISWKNEPIEFTL